MMQLSHRNPNNKINAIINSGLTNISYLLIDWQPVEGRKMKWSEVLSNLSKRISGFFQSKKQGGRATEEDLSPIFSRPTKKEKPSDTTVYRFIWRYAGDAPQREGFVDIESNSGLASAEITARRHVRDRFFKGVCLDKIQTEIALTLKQDDPPEVPE